MAEIVFDWQKVNPARFRYLDTEHPNTNKMLQLFWRIPLSRWNAWQESRFFISAVYAKHGSDGIFMCAASDGSNREYSQGDPEYKICGWETHIFKPYNDDGSYDHLDISDVEYEDGCYDLISEENMCFDFKDAKEHCEKQFNQKYASTIYKMLEQAERNRQARSWREETDAEEQE